MAEDTEEDRKPGSKKTMIAIVAVVVLLLLGGGGGAAFFLFPASSPEEETDEPDKGKRETGTVAFYDIPDVLVNINADNGRRIYLKLKISLEYNDPDTLPALEDMLPRIIDNFIVYTREMRIDDLQGSVGLYRLKEELMTRINTSISPAVITDVLFREMLVQ